MTTTGSKMTSLALCEVTFISGSDIAFLVKIDIKVNSFSENVHI